MEECTSLDGGEYTKTKWKNKTKMLFFDLYQIPTVIDNAECDFSSAINIYMLKVNQIGHKLTQ